MAMMIGILMLHLPVYLWGIHVNREYEIQNSHVNYMLEFGPRRNRLAHSLIFEEFEMQLEQWKEIEKEEQ